MFECYFPFFHNLQKETMTEQTTTPEQQAPVATPKTPRELLIEKYNGLFAKRAKLDKTLQAVVDEINAIDTLSSVGIGTPVVISVGKGEAAKDVLAEVIALRDDESGSRFFKVQYGSGFDAEIAVVPASKVRLPATQAA